MSLHPHPSSLSPAAILLAGFFLFLGSFSPLHAQTISLNNTLQQWGFSRDTTPLASTARWKNQWSHITVEKNKPWVLLNNTRVWLNTPVSENRGIFFMHQGDYAHTLQPIVAPTPSATAPVVRRILLDPGHGGHDVGTQNTRLGMQEKTFALDVARRVKFILEQQGYQVLLTRDNDTFVELEKRSLLARQTQADLFISIHFNSAAPAATPNGIETFILTPPGHYSSNDSSRKASTAERNAVEPGHRFGEWNALLGYYLQSSLVGKLDAEDRGLRRARFTVLRGLNCPGALVECGFLSNPSEAALIGKPSYRETIAQGIVDGILKYSRVVQQLRQATAPNPPRRS